MSNINRTTITSRNYLKEVIFSICLVPVWSGMLHFGASLHKSRSHIGEWDPWKGPAMEL